MAEKKNQSREKRPFTFNIGIVIFGAIFIYMIISLGIYLSTKHISSYMVTSGTLSNNETYTALALRSEELVNADAAGYVNYLVPDSAMASKDQTICSISTSKPKKQSTGQGQIDPSQARKLASAFSKDYSPSRFNAVYNFQYSLNSAVRSTSEQASVEGTAVNATDDGVICYTSDGYEDLKPTDVTAESFQSASYQSKQLKTDDAVTTGTPLFRIVTDDEWHLVFPLSDRQYTSLASRETIQVYFDKDGQTETGDLTLFDKDNVHYADISLYSGLVRYCNDRFLQIELVTNTQTGLKIPISAIVNKEFYVIPTSFLSSGGDDSESGFIREITSDDGTTTTEFVSTDLYEETSMNDGTEVYYVDEGDFHAGDVIIQPDSRKTFTIGETAVLEGVYCTNRGYAQFRKVNILDQNDEFCIIEEGTDYGISQYDYIVRDGSEVNESEILR